MSPASVLANHMRDAIPRALDRSLTMELTKAIHPNPSNIPGQSNDGRRARAVAGAETRDLACLNQARKHHGIGYMPWGTRKNLRLAKCRGGIELEAGCAK